MTDHPNYYSIAMVSLIALTVIVSAIFLIYPQLDIYLASLFADGENGFPLNQNAFLKVLRSFFNMEVAVLCITAVWMSFYARINKQLTKTPHQFWDMVIASFLAGPLVLVNMILKTYWGRPRPAQITEFGGASDFIPPYFMSDQCQSNCSFVSGEGSAIATAGILLGIATWTSFPRHRKTAITILAIISFIGISLRYIKGRHFVSDTLLATLFCAIIILIFHRLFKVAKVQQKITWRNILHDIGCAIRFKRDVNNT